MGPGPGPSDGYRLQGVAFEDAGRRIGQKYESQVGYCLVQVVGALDREWRTSPAPNQAGTSVDDAKLQIGQATQSGCRTNRG